MFHKIIKFQAVSSTQDVARRFAARKREIAVVSYCQRRGRGRRARTWFSPIGGLYVSLLLFPESKRTSIPFLAALVVIKTLESYGFSKLTLQWPNDVLLHNCKISGILCETDKDAVICGIGLNVNIVQFPKKLKMATSMKLETGKNYDLERVGEELIKRFGQFYSRTANHKVLEKEINKYIAGIGEAVEVVTNNKKYPGTVFGFDDDWSLLLRDENGIIHRFYYGDVRRLRW